MPMTLNVGASQKIADAHFGSRGTSVHLEIELDSTMAMDTTKLQQRIRQLFALVRHSLAEELGASRPTPASVAPEPGSSTETPPAQTSRPRPARSATQSQIKALYAIAKQQGIDLRAAVQQHYSISRPSDLSLAQASELIDNLKSDRTPTAA